MTVPERQLPGRPFIRPLMRALAVLMALIFAPVSPGQESAKYSPDPKIASALKEISPEKIHATIEQLVKFGTRSTLSAQDPGSIAAGHGIGAAREWIKSTFERYSKDCGGCLEVKTDAFTQGPVDRIPKPTQITNVYAVLKGSDSEAAKRVVLVTGHYDSRNSANDNI